ncbi:MAG: hypothetical protein ACI97A_000001, partial [Planctomycetota bacterium]
MKSFYEAYLSGDEGAEKYLGPPPTIDAVVAHARQIEQTEIHAEAIEILRQRIPPLIANEDSAIQESIAKLSQRPVFICAGQQPGLFGGTLLSLYKAITAIALSRALNDQGVLALPLFWNASEDHDFSEANRLCIPRHKEAQEPSVYKLSSERPNQSLSKIKVNDDDLDSLRRMIKENDLDPSFLPNRAEDFGTWNTRLVYALTKGSGLLVCEPHWFAKTLVPLREDFFDNREQLQGLVAHQSALMAEDHFPVPVKVMGDEAFHFFDSDNQRLKIRASGKESFEIDGLMWSAAGLVEALKQEPNRFTSSVLSRPIAQQYLFPVAAQVAGPTELTYLAQIREVYKPLSQQPPILWPRSHFLLLSQQDRDLTLKLPISGDDLLHGNYPIPAEPGDTIIENIESLIRKAFGEVEQIRDPDLRKKAIDLRRTSMREIKNLRKESKRLEKQRTKPLMRIVHQLKQTVQPRGIPQERIMGPMSLGFQADPELFDILKTAIDISSPG